MTYTLTLTQILLLIAIDIIFIGVLSALLAPLGFFRRAAFAVLRRNFVGYFSNPTGYVFLCLFVLLTSLAAFWPSAFFVNNLANLDQLNVFMPFIMLVFVPAITMSIWAEERRQGTDELLLTLPADDFDIVIGKYLAAAGVFTASLLFSQLSNFVVLASLAEGDVDTGLFFANYFGYWLMGLSMIAVGMVASFLTSNLTVSFILGVLFNAPLAFASMADLDFVPPTLSDFVVRWSIASQYEPFGRGVLSLSSMVYFIMIAAVGLYVCMVLIGRRHWLGGKDGDSLIYHYLVRVIALSAIALSITFIVSQRLSIRPDLTRDNTASLSSATQTIIKNVDAENPLFVHAFLSKDVPREYAETKREILSLLREFSAQGKIQVKIYNDIDTFSNEARLAEDRFGIRRQPVRYRSGGRIEEDEIILGAAFTSGLQRVVVPFFDYGIPVEYEMVRSINTVAKTNRKRLGVIETDAGMMGGGMAAMTGRPRDKQAIIVELEKQYEVESVNAMEPIADTYDVLLAVQPSAMAPEAMDNLIEAIQAGVPTAIFEDPVPYFMQVPGTGMQRQMPGGGQFGGQSLPKADIRKLWDVLGIQSPGGFPTRNFPGQPPLFAPHVAWHSYNPYEKLQLNAFNDEWVFVRNEAPGGENSLSPVDDITSGLSEILLPYPGAIEAKPGFTPTELLKTGSNAGTISYEALLDSQGDALATRANQKKLGRQTLAVKIQHDGAADDEGTAADEDAADDGGTQGDTGDGADELDSGIKAVYVADIDVLDYRFISIRARPDDMDDIKWNFDNVSFVLNVIDELSGDDAYVSIRNHKAQPSTLRLVESQVQVHRQRENQARRDYQEQYKKNVAEAAKERESAVEKLKNRLDELQKRQADGEIVSQVDLMNLNRQYQVALANAQRKEDIRTAQLEKDRDREIDRIQRDVDLDIRAIQRRYRFLALVLPPIIPAIVGIVVLFARLLREREGIERSRLK